MCTNLGTRTDTPHLFLSFWIIWQRLKHLDLGSKNTHTHHPHSAPENLHEACSRVGGHHPPPNADGWGVGGRGGGGTPPSTERAWGSPLKVMIAPQPPCRVHAWAWHQVPRSGHPRPPHKGWAQSSRMTQRTATLGSPLAGHSSKTGVGIPMQDSGKRSFKHIGIPFNWPS